VFSDNGTNSAKNMTVTFDTSGAYQFVVTVTDVSGLSTTSVVAVTVVPTFTALYVTPNPATVFVGATQQFSVTGFDQFGAAITNPTVTWRVSGGGSISTTGLYHAPATPGSAAVTATGGGLSAQADVRVVTRLPAPTNLSATPTSDYTAIDLSWTAPSGDVTGYYVYRGSSPGGESDTPLNNSPITGTTFRDATSTPGTTWFYTVKAVNAGGASGPSNEANATTAPDLALFQPAFASSQESAGTAARFAFDGDSNTRWSSQFSDPQWIYVDLGSWFNVTEVKLNWQNAAGMDYQIQVSDDASNWTTLVAVTGNTTAGWHDYPGLTGYGRYVRMYGTARHTQYGYSLWDFNVYGSPGMSPPGGSWGGTQPGRSRGVAPADAVIARWASPGFPRVTPDSTGSVAGDSRRGQVPGFDDGSGWLAQLLSDGGAGTGSRVEVRPGGPARRTPGLIVPGDFIWNGWVFTELDLAE
jgi:hypothetical protein